MEIFKRLFGGGGGGGASSGKGGSRAGDANGIYFYVRPTNCDEVVRLRIDRNNDLSLADDNNSYVVHKVVRGTKCFQSVEVDLYFDSGRRLVNSELQHGALVSEDEYEAWIDSQNSESSGG